MRRRDAEPTRKSRTKSRLRAKSCPRSNCHYRHACFEEAFGRLQASALHKPTGRHAREAVAICQDASPPFLFNHCLRAYFWARLLDEDHRPFDDEAVFTALLLHELGLCEGHPVHPDPGECFTIVGARSASELAGRHGWPDRRAALASEAIALHLNISVGKVHGKEARMVRTGSGGDVAGLGLDVLPGDQINAVVDRYPRLEMK
jgi:hypothetical protein